MNKKIDENMNKIIDHIELDFPETIPDFIVDKVVEDLKVKGLNIKINKRPALGTMAAIEWVIPTAIAAYIFKSYFDGFLKEAGKDHFNTLKSWLKSFVDKGRLIKTHTVYATKSSNKKAKSNTQSRSVSLLIQTKNEKIIKLLFDNDLNKEDWDNAIDQLLDFAIENYEIFPNDKLSTVINHIDPESKHKIYAIIDKDSKNILFYNERDIVTQ
jgi:hypothetical protein